MTDCRDVQRSARLPRDRSCNTAAAFLRSTWRWHRRRWFPAARFCITHKQDACRPEVEPDDEAVFIGTAGITTVGVENRHAGALVQRDGCTGCDAAGEIERDSRGGKLRITQLRSERVIPCAEIL